MATILDMVRVIKQLKEAAGLAYRFPDLHSQLAHATLQFSRMGDLQAQIAKAADQFRTVDEVLQKARFQMQIRDDLFLARTEAVSHLAAPAFESSHSIIKMLERFPMDKQLSDIAAKSAKDWNEILKTSELARQRTFLPVETHLTRLYELSAISEASLLRVRPGSLGRRIGLDDHDRADLAASHETLPQQSPD